MAQNAKDAKSPKDAKSLRPRGLHILTRSEGVRRENPLLTDAKGKYWPPSKLRTPAIRKEADKFYKGKSADQLKAPDAKRLSKRG